VFAENVLPASTFFLPYYVWRLADESKKFQQQDYKTAADAVRKSADKLLEHGEQVMLKQVRLVQVVEGATGPQWSSGRVVQSLLWAICVIAIIAVAARYLILM